MPAGTSDLAREHGKFHDRRRRHVLRPFQDEGDVQTPGQFARGLDGILAATQHKGHAVGFHGNGACARQIHGGLVQERRHLGRQVGLRLLVLGGIGPAGLFADVGEGHGRGRVHFVHGFQEQGGFLGTGDQNGLSRLARRTGDALEFLDLTAA